MLNVLRTARLPILQQLYLEEAILRGTKENWLIVNDGAFNPAIVMGISGWVQIAACCFRPVLAQPTLGTAIIGGEPYHTHYTIPATRCTAR